jgi:hypothetical protein
MPDEKHRQAVGTFGSEHQLQDRLWEKTRGKTASSSPNT